MSSITQQVALQAAEHVQQVEQASHQQGQVLSPTDGQPKAVSDVWSHLISSANLGPHESLDASTLRAFFGTKSLWNIAIKADQLQFTSLLDLLHLSSAEVVEIFNLPENLKAIYETRALIYSRGGLDLVMQVCDTLEEAGMCHLDALAVPTIKDFVRIGIPPGVAARLRRCLDTSPAKQCLCSVQTMGVSYKAWPTDTQSFRFTPVDTDSMIADAEAKDLHLRPSDLNEKYRAEIRALLKVASQSDLASILGLSQSYLSLFLNDKHTLPPTSDKLKTIISFIHAVKNSTFDLRSAVFALKQYHRERKSLKSDDEYPMKRARIKASKVCWTAEQKMAMTNMFEGNTVTPPCPKPSDEQVRELTVRLIELKHQAHAQTLALNGQEQPAPPQITEDEIALLEHSVKVWFKNRRQTTKRANNEKETRESEQPDLG